MKNHKLPCVAMMIWMALPAFGAAVQTVSETFVGSAVTIPGVQGSAERIGFFSLRAVRPAVYAGKVSAVGATSITDSGANWTSAQFAARGPLYAEFANGVEADIQQVSFAAKRLSFSGALPPSITVGARYRIREHHTVAEVFGSGNQAGLLAGLNIDDAETVRHFIPETQQTRIYFYSTLSGLTGWLLDDYTPAGTTIIYPEQGLMVRRRTAANLTLTSSGPLKPGPSTIPVLPGYNMLGLYHRATPVRIDQLNLLASGFVPGENADVADNLLKFNPDGTTTTYFYWNLAGFEGWYDFEYQPAASATLSPGTVFMIYRRPPSQVFDWTLPSQ
ncbi:MAG TPA: hypothetical protein VJ063_16905 [Verrucomicrobiae bacterium]|nr:hypothetical protein [Verrucomicrobiae bacterium]